DPRTASGPSRWLPYLYEPPGSDGGIAQNALESLVRAGRAEGWLPETAVVTPAGDGPFPSVEADTAEVAAMRAEIEAEVIALRAAGMFDYSSSAAGPPPEAVRRFVASGAERQIKWLRLAFGLSRRVRGALRLIDLDHPPPPGVRSPSKDDAAN